MITGRETRHNDSSNGQRQSQNGDDSTTDTSDAAEKAVLASVLRAGRMIESASALAEDDFRVFAHHLIWRAIVGLSREGKVCDSVNVAHFLKTKEQIGNRQICPEVSYSYLSELIQFAIIQEGVFEYVEIVRENSNRRKLCLAGKQIQAIANSRGANQARVVTVR